MAAHFKNGVYKIEKMTSMLRSFALPPKALTKFHAILTPSYNDSTYGLLPFPFTYSNGVLDIQYIDNFEADMVTDTGNEPNNEPANAVQLLGGSSLVTSLGDNFKSYIRAWRDGTIDVGSPIEIYVKPSVQKIQVTTFVDDSSSWRVSTTPPTGDNYTVGSVENNFRTTWIFKTPFTFTIVESGVTKYITFNSQVSED